MATKPGGGGAKGLSGRATKKRTFFCDFPKQDLSEQKFVNKFYWLAVLENDGCI